MTVWIIWGVIGCIVLSVPLALVVGKFLSRREERAPFPPEDEEWFGMLRRLNKRRPKPHL